MGRGDSGGRGVALLRRSRGVSRQGALCNRLLQEAQTGEYTNVITLLRSADGQDDFWNERRLEQLRDELIYDLTARAMLGQQRNLRRMLRLIDAEGLDHEAARILTARLSGRLLRHFNNGLITTADDATAAADTEFSRALVKTLAEQADEEAEQAVSYFLDQDYPRFQAALAARHTTYSLGSLISDEQWRALFGHLLLAQPDNARQQAHDYLCACLTGDHDFANHNHWQTVTEWTGPTSDASEAPFSLATH